MKLKVLIRIEDKLQKPYLTNYIDSARFMACTLPNLVDNLADNEHVHDKQPYKNTTVTKK